MVTIATVLTSDAEIFQGGLSVKESIRTVKRSYHPSSDHVSIAMLYHEWEKLCAEDAIDALIFSQQNGLNNEKMKLISSKEEYVVSTVTAFYDTIQMYLNVCQFQTGLH
jgi:hypothetical protein